MFNGVQKITGSNQGEVSNEWKTTKKNTQLSSVENPSGNESTLSSTAGLGAATGQQAPFMAPPNEINITASSENRSAKFKAPNVSDNPGEFSNQYQ